MAELVRWETPFCETEYPSVGLIVKWDENQSEIIIAVVAPSGLDEYPKYLVDFGRVVAFTSMEEAHSPRDFVAIQKPEEALCAYEYLDSPWLHSYDVWKHFFNGPIDPDTNEPLEFRHFLIFGGDNNIEVITPNTPRVEEINQKQRIEIGFKT